MKLISFVAASVIAFNLSSAQQSDDLAIWREFVRLVRADSLTVERVRPPEPMTRESQVAVLRAFSKGADWKEWEAAPKVVHHGDLVTFIATLGAASGSPWTYTFNFVIGNGTWYYRFLEGVMLPLDSVTAFPATGSEFPDVSEATKAWVRNEFYWSQMVRVFGEIAALKGKEEALSFFRDGDGYALAATVWVPFYPTHRAFVLYLCWEQAKLQGNTVTLESLSEHEAVVRITDDLYFALYQRASHIKNQISFDDYGKIFETIWQDRARAAGWSLAIEGKGREIYLRFSR